jgi:hypothetical protein
MLFITGLYNKPLPLLWLIESGSSSLEREICSEEEQHASGALTHAFKELKRAVLNGRSRGSAMEFKVRIRA